MKGWVNDDWIFFFFRWTISLGCVNPKMAILLSSSNPLAELCMMYYFYVDQKAFFSKKKKRTSWWRMKQSSIISFLHWDYRSKRFKKIDGWWSTWSVTRGIHLENHFFKLPVPLLFAGLQRSRQTDGTQRLSPRCVKVSKFMPRSVYWWNLKKCWCLVTSGWLIGTQLAYKI